MLLAGTMFCAGCLHTVDTVENYEKSYVADEFVRAHFETDASASIKVRNGRQATAANGFLLISYEFVNRSSSPQSAMYRLNWYDENGMPVPTSLSQWSEIRLPGRGARWINFTAPNARAKDHGIEIIEKE
jgi:uncharacterized protein YcfL